MNKLDKLRISKTPSSKDRSSYVGVEIEFSYPRDRVDFALKLIEAKLDKYCSLGEDGRPNEGHWSSLEVRCLVKEKESYKVLTRLGDLIVRSGGQVNNSHGLHVHLDMRFRESAQSYANLVRCQPIIYAMAAKWRSRSHWCTRQEHTELYLAKSGKHAGINPILRPGKYTIEVRIHEGIVNGKDIARYVNFLTSIVDSRVPHKIASLNTFNKYIKPTKRTKEYMIERLKLHKRKALLKGVA